MFFLWKSFPVQLQTWDALPEVGVLYAESGYSCLVELRSEESGGSVQNQGVLGRVGVLMQS